MTNTAMMIDPRSLNYFGDSARPVAVLCAATLNILGHTTGPVCRGRLEFGGVKFTTHRASNGSQWLVLNAEVQS